MPDEPREKEPPPDPLPPPRHIDPAADADSESAVPIYPPAQGDGS